MKCVVLFKKDVVWFCLKRKLRGKIIRCGGERAKRAGEKEKRSLFSSGSSFWEISVRETVCRGKLWAIKRGER